MKYGVEQGVCWQVQKPSKWIVMLNTGFKDVSATEGVEVGVGTWGIRANSGAGAPWTCKGRVGDIDSCCEGKVRDINSGLGIYLSWCQKWC